MFLQKNYKNIAGYHIVLVIILALCFLFCLKVNKVKAEVWDPVTRSESNYKIGDTLVVMKDGVITVTTTSNAAPRKGVWIEYDIIGFTISKSRQSQTVTTTIGEDVFRGPAAPEILGEYPLSKPNSSIPVGSDIVATYIMDSGTVNNILGGELGRISNSTQIFLNAVFRTVYVVDGLKTVRQGKEHITTWENIINAEAWQPKTLPDFKDYFNLPLDFTPGRQTNNLYYDYGGISDLQDGKLASKFINERVKWSGIIPPTISDSADRIYILEGYEVETKLSSETIYEGIKSWNDTAAGVGAATVMSNVDNGWVIEPLGGVDVHIKYKLDNRKYKNTLHYLYNNEVIKYVCDLDEKKIDEDVTWETQAEDHAPSSLYPGDFVLQGYYIKSNKTRKIIYQKYKAPGNGVTDSSILSASFKEIEGGIDVCLVYGSGDPVTPIPLPTQPPVPGNPTPTPVPSLPPLAIPSGGAESKALDTILTVGAIRADLRGSERFNVLQGIPTTESLYTQVRGNEYNIGYRFVKKVEILDYPIKVTKTYILKWTDAKNKTTVKTDTVVVPMTVTVKRACAYWTIENFDYYTIDKAILYNKALPGGVATMYPNYSFYSPPSLILSHNDSRDYHIIPPVQYGTGIILEDETLPTGNGVKPTIPEQDFKNEATYEANVRTDQIKVRNDYVSFDGAVVMDSSLYVKESPALSNLSVLNRNVDMNHQNVLYKPNQVIPATILNDIYQSNGTLTYKNHPSAVVSYGSIYEVPIRGLNSVTVHTPVICDASITTANAATGITSNDPYVQALNIDKDRKQLVIDPDSKLSDFTVDIDNYGKHLSISGYFTRDFAWGIRDGTVSYLAEKNNIYRNEVKFPFDVFYRKTSGEDEFIAKNTWIRFGHSTPTFYLPMWVNEGDYTVDFRTIAVNGVNTDSQLTKTQTYANTDRSNYVATDTVRVQVSGRIYGLTLYDVTDYPTWETVFRTTTGSAKLKLNEGYVSGVTKDKYNEGYSYDYTVGTFDQYGKDTGRLNRFTLPLVNGSHPKYTNVGILKTGYAVKFKVTTTGNAFSSDDSVTVKPTFYYVDADGKNRREVDVYYTEFFNGRSNNLVKMGGSLDLTNIKSYKCGDQYLGIPNKQLELMAGIKNIVLGKYLWSMTDLFTYTNIRIRSPLMTYVNTDYLQRLKSGTQYEAILATGVTDVGILRRMQTYYAEYYLPADIKAVEKGFDVYGYAAKHGVKSNEAFWLTGGYIIVSFDMVTTDADGNKNLSYLNLANASDGYCSMWNLENYVTSKVSYNGKRDKSTVFKFLPGDFMVYYTDKSIQEDYVSYIIG